MESRDVSNHRLEKVKSGKDLLNKFKNRKKYQSNDSIDIGKPDDAANPQPSSEEGYVSMEKHSPQLDTSVPSDMSDSTIVDIKHGTEPSVCRPREIAENVERLLKADSELQQIFSRTLQSDLDAAKLEGDSLRAKLAEKATELSESAHNCIQLESKLANQSLELASIVQKCFLLESQLASQTAELAEYSEKCIRLESQLNESNQNEQSLLADLRKELDEKRVECEMNSQIQAGGQQQHSALLSKLSDAQHEMKVQQIAYQTLKDESDRKVQHLTTDLQSKLEENETLQKYQNELQNRLTLQLQQSAKYDKDLNEMRITLEQRETDLKALKEQFADKNAENDRLKTDIEALSRGGDVKSSNLTEQLSSVTLQLTGSSEKCKRLEELVVQLEADVSTIRESSSAEIQALVKSKSSLETELVKLRSTNESLSRQLENHAKFAKQQLEQSEEIIQGLNADLKRERSGHAASISQSKQEIEALSEQIRTAERQILGSVPKEGENWRQRFEESCVKITALVKEQRELRQQLDQQQQRLQGSVLHQTQLEEVYIDNENLKARNETLIKLVAKLTSLSWDQERKIEKLKSRIMKQAMDVGQSRLSATSASQKSVKPAVTWTIPVNQ